ncbi:MAG: glycosyltransferase family 4 protein [archaeon]
MFGWEFPPFNEGGLGTACYDLTKGLAKKGVNITFVMPYASENSRANFVKLIGANNIIKNLKIKKINSLLTPYQTSDSYDNKYERINSRGLGKIYGKNIYEEVLRFSYAAKKVAKEEADCDIIHAHDWMTYEAGYFAKEQIKKPLVIHIHATEYDRTGGNPNKFIAGREEWGLRVADKIIANSNYTKQNVIRCYNINPDKIDVIHWGIDPENPDYNLNERSPFNDEKIVLFLGRVTLQKGPDYFVEVANKVLHFNKKVKFVVVGDGDMLPRMINRVNELGIANKFIFTGSLRGSEVHKAFQMADLYVMPSTSEPFGLTALESLKNNTPIMISKQSGVSEVVTNALKVDFWDIDEMTNKIVNCLEHSSLIDELRINGSREACKFNLETPAEKCICTYNQVLRGCR